MSYKSNMEENMLMVSVKGSSFRSSKVLATCLKFHRFYTIFYINEKIIF